MRVGELDNFVQLGGWKFRDKMSISWVVPFTMRRKLNINSHRLGFAVARIDELTPPKIVAPLPGFQVLIAATFSHMHLHFSGPASVFGFSPDDPVAQELGFTEFKNTDTIFRMTIEHNCHKEFVRVYFTTIGNL